MFRIINKFIQLSNKELFKNMQRNPSNNNPIRNSTETGVPSPKRQNNKNVYQRPPFTMSDHIPLPYKIIVAIIFITGYTLYRIFYQKFDNSSCLVDVYFEATFDTNRWLRNGADNAVIGIGQVMMDGWILFMGIGWLVLVKNMRFPLAAGIIFLFRTIFLNIQKLPFDDYIVWHNPGFLSLTVPYDRTRDFFFSGHTSTLTIIMIECFVLGWTWVGIFAFINLLYMMNMLIITRIHYSIDIMAALIFTAVIYRLTMLILKYIDYVLSIPFYIGRFIYYKVKKSQDPKHYELLRRPQTQHEMYHNQYIQ